MNNSFVNERTNVTIYAPLDDSLIHATMRNCDIIPIFLDALRDTAEYAQLLPTLPSIVTDPSASEWDAGWNTEECDGLVFELFDILNDYAPDGYYFGATLGDGSDYGYWKNEDEF